ncbi:carbon-nitrogen hydrolase family protein [Yoonia sp. SS1-5]|uniref:Carbon-nitrogen hydrolase family protein n=1 Tax=Yoonia rhodophyticola TaxID=3137370 RepID=A0AAN0M9L6_9RHOB
MTKIAAVQAAPEWLDAKGTTDKTIALIEQAGRQDIRLLGFGESWLPGYPHMIFLHPPMETMPMVMKYRENAICIDGPEMKAIREACERAGVWVMLGFAERDKGSIYAAQALIDDHGNLRMTRRKLRPTHMERTVWGEGPATDIKVVETPFATVGGLVCFENVQPIMRHGMYALGEQIHVACWPSFGLFKGLRKTYAFSKEANLNECFSYALQGQCFVIAANSIIRPEDIDTVTMGNDALKEFIQPGGGAAAVYGPDGYRLTEPLDEHEDGFAIAEFDASYIEKAKIFADPAGHYFRPDVAKHIFEGKNTSVVAQDAADQPDPERLTAAD